MNEEYFPIFRQEPEAAALLISQYFDGALHMSLFLPGVFLGHPDLQYKLHFSQDQDGEHWPNTVTSSIPLKLDLDKAFPSVAWNSLTGGTKLDTFLVEQGGKKYLSLNESKSIYRTKCLRAEKAKMDEDDRNEWMQTATCPTNVCWRRYERKEPPTPDNENTRHCPRFFLLAVWPCA